nr:contact-dependent growth inhibition system immunity protein [Caulobacter sp. NIBR2454]
MLDEEVRTRTLPFDADDADIGTALRRTLLSTRIRIPNGRVDWGTEGFRRNIAIGYGLQSNRNALSGLKRCEVRMRLGTLRLESRARQFGGGFAAFQPGFDEGHEDIVMRFKAPDAELGAAVREALRRSL